MYVLYVNFGKVQISSGIPAKTITYTSLFGNCLAMNTRRKKISGKFTTLQNFEVHESI